MPTEPFSRPDWLLLFLSRPSDSESIDQIQIMKGMFLLSQEGPATLRPLFHFVPYNYGPFDIHVYDDLRLLQSNALITGEAVIGTNQVKYTLTQQGLEKASSLERAAVPSDLDKLSEIRKLVTSLSFLDLLRYVYKKYPDFAVNSVAHI